MCIPLVNMININLIPTIFGSRMSALGVEGSRLRLSHEILTVVYCQSHSLLGRHPTIIVKREDSNSAFHVNVVGET